jgi:hypothetical protein
MECQQTLIFFVLLKLIRLNDDYNIFNIEYKYYLYIEVSRKCKIDLNTMAFKFSILLRKRLDYFNQLFKGLSNV